MKIPVAAKATGKAWEKPIKISYTPCLRGILSLKHPPSTARNFNFFDIISAKKRFVNRFYAEFEFLALIIGYLYAGTHS